MLSFELIVLRIREYTNVYRTTVRLDGKQVHALLLMSSGFAIVIATIGDVLIWI